MDMDLEIHIDRRRCIGAGQCVHVAPGTFDQDEAAMAFVTDPCGERPDRIVAAVTACPMEAISLSLAGVVIGPRDLRDWAVGARLDDPLIERIGAFADAHHELRAVLGESRPHDGGLASSEAIEALRDHLRDEANVGSALADLVPAALIEPFDCARRRILAGLDALAVGTAAAGPDSDQLARAVEGHIELEEAVLFPVALSALARREGRLEIAAGS